MIKSGGLNVSSQEVERALQAHPDVVRAAVVGLPDDYWSEVVTGFVIVVDGSDLTGQDVCETTARADSRPTRCPRRCTSWTSCPTDPQGKLLKRELRRLHAQD